MLSLVRLCIRDHPCQAGRYGPMQYWTGTKHQLKAVWVTRTKLHAASKQRWKSSQRQINEKVNKKNSQIELWVLFVFSKDANSVHFFFILINIKYARPFYLFQFYRNKMVIRKKHLTKDEVSVKWRSWKWEQWDLVPWVVPRRLVQRYHQY